MTGHVHDLDGVISVYISPKVSNGYFKYVQFLTTKKDGNYVTGWRWSLMP